MLRPYIFLMNFLAHFVLATRSLEPAAPLPAYVLGNALPDLLPLAGPRSRFRLVTLAHAPTASQEDAALCAGVQAHLLTDAAFHSTGAFTQAQESVKRLLRDGGFFGMRLRPFFVAHVLTELALDAALLRAEPTLVDSFYTAFAAADFAQSAQWTEAALHTPLPSLPGVLARFARSRYLDSYASDAGVAEGLSRLCARARQDMFVAENFVRLIPVVAATVRLVGDLVPALLAETAAGMAYPPTMPK